MTSRYPSSEARQYSIEHDAPRVECDCCDRPATTMVVVRWGPMRGSDIESHAVCNRHRGMYVDGFTRFLAHMRSKDKFLKRQPRQPQEVNRVEQ